MKNIIKKVLPVLDMMLVLFVYPAAWLLKNIRRAGMQRLPRCKNALMNVGVFPIRDHYYEPQFDHRITRQPFAQDRRLSGINWNTHEQLEILKTFLFAKELTGLSQNKPDRLDFYLDNGSFKSGDAEYWYQLIRAIKPKRVFEVGSGNSTLMAIKAIHKNQVEDSSYNCKHICIEPYPKFMV